VNRSADDMADLPPNVATVTSTDPAPAGATAVSEVAEVKVTLVAGVKPNATVAKGDMKPLPVKPVPVMMTRVPPVSGPVVGLMPVTVGTAK